MDYRNTYPYSSSTKKENDYSEYYKKNEYNDDNDNKYNKDKNNEKDEKIISSTINRPNNDNFESDKSSALNNINKKQEILSKYKIDIQGKIEGFNEQMNSLLELKECHKQPFNLNEIKLERINNNSDKDIDSDINKIKAEIIRLEIEKPTLLRREPGCLMYVNVLNRFHKYFNIE